MVAATSTRHEIADAIDASQRTVGSSSVSWNGYVLDQTDDALDLIDLARRDPEAVPDPLNLES